jgi:hypothetical protein
VGKRVGERGICARSVISLFDTKASSGAINLGPKPFGRRGDLEIAAHVADRSPKSVACSL